jgi:7,8-dihydropterin-6-yl-methyl-4-(beta-D-ribofuranosyl)aminobenzene 5'-phosphate synthase
MDKPKVYLVKPVQDFLTKIVADGKGELVQVDKEFQLCKNVYSTGLIGTQITEHSLIIDSPKGLIMMTGCSHPGIVDMVKRAKELYKKNVYYVGGGFHLMNHSKELVMEIISELKKLGVVKCGASHCTGDNAIKQFKEAFGSDFVELGVGRVL